MSRPIHFEIHVDDIARARTFYETALGWTFEDWSEYAGMPYLGATTGTDDGPGINGALMQRQGGGVTPGAPIQGAVLTIGVDDYDPVEQKILAAGGTVAMPKAPLPGMAWQGYYLDTEGNVFGIHQPDENAK